jgi:L-alanine-DL-glutamate epimerase-like enolase superfamily enzyme
LKIVSVEAVPLAVSFKRTFRFGTTDRSTSPNVVLVVRTDDDQVGYGEACPVPAFTSETQASVVELIEQRVEPVLIGQDPTRRGPLLADLARVLKFAPFTTAAVDTALLDLTGRALGVPVSALLGGAYRDRVEVHGSVGWDEDPACMADLAVEQAATYRSIKTYAGRGDIDADLDRLQAVRDAVGPGVGLFVDVNGLWSPSDLLRALRRVDDIGLTMLEQPLPLHAAGFLRGLVDSLRMDVCADEGVRTLADADRVAAERSATVVNLGHSKLGGPSVAVQAAHVAIAAGLGLMVGGVIEMGVANAMGLHLAAALPRLAYPAYLMGPLKYRQQLTTTQIEVVESHVAVPPGAGLGIEVDEVELRRLDARRQ